MTEIANNKIIGIDFGSKRVGIALSDGTGKLALPHTVIVNSSKLAEEIARIAHENGAALAVIGESRNYQGQPNEIFAAAEVLGQELEKRGLRTEFEPEFLTSAQAEHIQGKNDKIDASAAALILQSYLDKHNNN